ncbi:MAG: hypothetical protein AB7K24_15640, partial [Gemmataceae bacterium]
AVATSPYVMEPADAASGGREPPDDAGQGTIRLLDRPLWGRRELFVRTAPSFAPDTKLYQGLAYQPAAPTELTKQQGHIVSDFIRAARQRGLKVYLQVQAAIPPGYRVQFGGPRDEDQPRLPDGRVPAQRVARNASLASQTLRDYQAALIRDLCRAYPDITGLRFDWPEYPPYSLDDCFVDFSESARAAAKRLGFDFEAMKTTAGQLYQQMHGGLDSQETLENLLDIHNVTSWLRFKAALVEELLAGFRAVLNEAAGANKELMPNAFPPPWAAASGFDFARTAPHCSAISVKLYTMHWPMMLQGYARTLLAANPRLDEKRLLHWLADLLGLDRRAGLAGFHYPGPEEPHGVRDEVLRAKIDSAQASAGRTPILTLAHSYGPVDDVERRLRAGFANPHGMWINRYGYLSDEKIARVAAMGKG